MQAIPLTLTAFVGAFHLVVAFRFLIASDLLWIPFALSGLGILLAAGKVPRELSESMRKWAPVVSRTNTVILLLTCIFLGSLSLAKTMSEQDHDKGGTREYDLLTRPH